MDKPCPNCSLINPASATCCDCGWTFDAGTFATDSQSQHWRKTIESRARASWVLPLVAWISQFTIAIALNGIRAGWIFYALTAIAQFALLVAGLVLAIRVLKLNPKASTPPARTAAWTGLLLSAGTLALIGGLSLLAVFGRD